MRTHGSLKVLPLVVLALPLVIAQCQTSHQYWDEVREICRNCSSCKEPSHIVLRPCQVHQDTLCGPLHALNIDWSWLGHRSRNTSHHYHHHHQKKNGHRVEHYSSWSSSGKRYHKHWHHSNSSTSHHHRYHHHHKKLRPPESAAQLKALEEDHPAYAESRSPEPLTQTTTPFTTPETLVWDWQAVVLALAVFACVVFFGAAAGYGVRQVRHDACRTADVEDLSATLSLMVPGMGSELPESCAPSVEGCNTNQCLYMEQLLVRKQQDGCGNVYIERENNGSPRM